MNGEPSCANEWLLKTVLRDTWQFDGYVTSDCDAEGDQAMRNKYPNPSDAVAAILKAGTDVDCVRRPRRTHPHARLAPRL